MQAASRVRPATRSDPSTYPPPISRRPRRGRTSRPGEVAGSTTVASASRQDSTNVRPTPTTDSSGTEMLRQVADPLTPVTPYAEALSLSPVRSSRSRSSICSGTPGPIGTAGEASTASSPSTLRVLSDGSRRATGSAGSRGPLPVANRSITERTSTRSWSCHRQSRCATPIRVVRAGRPVPRFGELRTTPPGTPSAGRAAQCVSTLGTAQRRPVTRASRSSPRRSGVRRIGVPIDPCLPWCSRTTRQAWSGPGRLWSAAVADGD